MRQDEAAEATATAQDTNLVIETHGRDDYGWVHLPEATIRDPRLSVGDIGMLAWMIDRLATHDKVAEQARMQWGVQVADKHMRALYKAGYIVMRPDGGLDLHDTSTLPGGAK